MVEFASNSGIKLLTFIPYNSQENGQVEAANKIIIGLIKRDVGQKPRNWHKTLDQILRACRNSSKVATNSTPFRLKFGHDRVFPVEIYLYLTRVQRQVEILFDHY